MDVATGQRGSTVIIYLAVITAVLAFATGMKTVVQRAAQARIYAATVNMLNLPDDPGDGVFTQTFGVEANEDSEGFLDDPSLVATANSQMRDDTTDIYAGRTLNSNQVMQTTSDSRQVVREILGQKPSAGEPPAVDDVTGESVADALDTGGPIKPGVSGLGGRGL
jgi:hypothetical protein